MLDAVVRNFRTAFRLLRKSPGFALTAIITLALCIGANTAIFTVVDTVLLRPLPYPEPDRLARITVLFQTAEGSDDNTSVDGRQWEYVRDHVRTVDVALHSQPQGVNLSTSQGAEYIQQLRVSAGFFRVLGVSPLMGREIDPEEDRPNGPPVAVVSHGFWQRTLHADPAAAGKSVVLRGEPYTIVGVMPRIQYDASG
jgi:hypothetical protein